MVYRHCPLRSFRTRISPRCSSRFKVVGLIPTWWAASPMRIRRLLMPVSPDLSGSFAAIPDHVLPAFARGDVADAQALSVPLQDGVRLLPPLGPAVPWTRLTVCLPRGKNDGLPVFRFCARVGEV